MELGTTSKERIRKRDFIAKRRSICRNHIGRENIFLSFKIKNVNIFPVIKVHTKRALTVCSAIARFTYWERNVEGIQHIRNPGLRIVRIVPCHMIRITMDI